MTANEAETRTQAGRKPCDKCGAPVATNGGWHGVACMQCGSSYLRCEACGGSKGARRSLASHRGLHHPGAR